MAVSNIIVSTIIGGKIKYLFNTTVGPDKVRRPVYVDELEKAKRFFLSADAYNYITAFAGGDLKKHNIEEFKSVKRSV